MSYDKCGFLVSAIALVISIPALFYAHDSYDLAHNQLVSVQANLTNLEHELNVTNNNFIFLKTESCQKVWFNNAPEMKWVGCWNGTYWYTCQVSKNFQTNKCNETQWFHEVAETYSWQNTQGTFGVN